MAKDFYYQVMGEVFGPMTGVRLRDKALEGDVNSDTLVRVGADGEWVLASRLTSLFDESGRPIPHQPEQAGPPRELELSEGGIQPAVEQVREEPAPAAAKSYALLRLYSRLTMVVGVIGIVASVLGFMLAVRQEQSVVTCVLSAVGSFGLMAFGEAIIAFIDLVEENRATKELLAKSVQQQAQALEHLRQIAARNRS